MPRIIKVLLAAAILLGAVAPPSPTAAQTDGPTYVVQEGDTLIAIADRFGSTPEAIGEANAISDISRIFPGMELWIPGFPGVTGRLETRLVRFGESIDSLRLRYGVPTSAQVRLNRVVNPERIFAGEEWVVPVSEAGEAGAAYRATRPGRGILQSAVVEDQGAWRLAARRDHPFRRWLVPGEAIPIPSPSGFALAIPEPALEVRIETIPVVQGRLAEFTVRTAESVELHAIWDGRILPFHTTAPSEYVALQGIPALAEPGLVEVELSLTSSEGLLLVYRQSVRLVSGGYGFDPILTVPPETIDPEFTGPEDELIRALVALTSEDRLWTGIFQAPSEGTYTSRFGSRRNYNNTGYRFYHTGLDFSGRTGVPILAPASGRVVFAGPLEVRGNTTFLDHGWGIFTAYLHQSEILVEVGQVVEVGQTIGLVGGTGRATGPHLHWEVWANGVPVDPLQWLEGEFP
ncbi:MAG: peptidoglycan DD-metalloendopeptidase family protein [Anaerolineales bacterium]